MGLSSPLIKPHHGEIVASAWWDLAIRLGAAFGLCRATAVATSPPPIHPPIYLPSGEVLLGHWAGNLPKKPSFFSPWDEQQLDDISAPVGAPKQVIWGAARPDTAYFAAPVAPALDPCEPCPDGSLIQSIWASGSFLT